MNDISQMKLEGLMDGINTVGEFLDKYSNIYPSLNEEEFQKQLDYLEEEFFCNL